MAFFSAVSWTEATTGLLLLAVLWLLASRGRGIDLQRGFEHPCIAGMLVALLASLVLDRVSFVAQSLLDESGDLTVVFHQQNLHCRGICERSMRVPRSECEDVFIIRLREPPG